MSTFIFFLGLLLAATDALTVGSAARPGVVRCATITAQMAPAPTKTRQKVKTNGPGGGGSGGGAPTAAVAKPKLKRVTEDVPLWKVLLLGDNDYEEDPVCRLGLQPLFLRMHTQPAPVASPCILVLTVAPPKTCPAAGVHGAEGGHPGD